MLRSPNLGQILNLIIFCEIELCASHCYVKLINPVLRQKQTLYSSVKLSLQAKLCQFLHQSISHNFLTYAIFLAAHVHRTLHTMTCRARMIGQSFGLLVYTAELRRFVEICYRFLLLYGQSSELILRLLGIFPIDFMLPWFVKMNYWCGIYKLSSYKANKWILSQWNVRVSKLFHKSSGSSKLEVGVHDALEHADLIPAHRLPVLIQDTASVLRVRAPEGIRPRQLELQGKIGRRVHMCEMNKSLWPRRAAVIRR